MDLGVGHLLPVEVRPFSVAQWVGDVVLPLYTSPEAEHPAGWLARGWLLVDGQELVFDTSSMIEIGYEFLSFVVFEIRSDGWFRFQIGRATPPSVTASPGADPVVFWAHVSHLDLGEVALEVERWEELFQQPETPPLHFRDGASRHALRHGPSPDADLAAWIGGDHSMELLEIAGDWMRVRVSQPAAICPRSETLKRAVHEGWIRWRGAEKGPWVWFPTRGC